jgi:prepilin-type N-terminal cleavage/methylation domain-containing protein
MKARAFTLVELLVVITIIVILLALLTPALDKAMYAAEMARCGAQLKGIATGGTVYATANKRFYPAPLATEHVYWAALLGATDGGFPGDRRKVWKEAVGSINAAFECPLLGGGLDLETTRSDHISSNYELFAGWGFEGNPAMRKIGDRLVFHNPLAPQSGPRRYDVIAGDRNIIQGFTDVQSSHPDSTGKLTLMIRQDGPDLWKHPTARITTALWWTDQGIDRGSVDNNFAATDTSVQRFNGIEADHDESEIGRVPIYYDADNGAWPLGWSYVPLN